MVYFLTESFCIYSTVLIIISSPKSKKDVLRVKISLCPKIECHQSIYLLEQQLYSLKIQMLQKQNTQQSMQPKESLRGKQKYKELLAHSKQYQTLCLNQSQLKHMHAIRPYCSKQRKSSRRQSKLNQSPYEMSRSNSKRLENSSKKSQDSKIKKNSEIVGNKQMSQMLSELINLKSEYKILKGNYTKILSQKQEEILQYQKDKKNISQELQKRQKQAQKYQKTALLLQQQNQRIKKQCAKILQMQKFKIKKLQQTLQQKELMIAFLRNELDNTKKGGNSQNNQPLFFLQNSAGLLNFSYFNKPPNNVSALSNIMPCEPSRQLNEAHPDQDSLSLSRDKSKEMDSIIHSFLSNSNDHLHHANFGKKENIKIDSLQQSPIQVQIDVIEEKSQPSEKQIFDNKLIKQFKDVSELSKQVIGPIKTKMRPKKLQIIISDENSDRHNIQHSLKQQVSMDTKKKMTNSSIMCKQKKKLTAKKIKPI